MAEIDKQLLARTARLIEMFDSAAARLNTTKDHKIFFTWAHGYITKQIYKHIKLFKQPNELMKLNDAFATVFLDAVNGRPHEGWIRAFKVCDGLTDAKSAGFIEMIAWSMGTYETCAACMAKIHISQDLKNALKKHKVDAQDYGDTLLFVNEGHLYAEKQLRGTFGATITVLASAIVMYNLNMNAEVWRNKAYKEATGQDVPKPTEAFKAAVRQNNAR